MPLIVHISDLHISELGFDEDVFIKAVAEINAVLIEDNRSITASQIWLMPMGTTKEQQEAIQRKVAQQAINHGYNFCARVHVWVFDNEIGT